ncbi:MAG: hypothetical protein EOP38_02665 [Rubrivivax sp.]|nr:MAG: hypothetical protein EOP38_02665 [Rubrivivax sp.]
MAPARLPAAMLTAVPALADMPAMMRRRVDRLGRLACQVAYAVQPEGQTQAVPMVFASRYGDAARSLSLLGDLSQAQALSPTGFGLSVHNAISALYAMARADVQNAVVVAAGRATVLAALTEAAALLADGAPEVLVVYYEAPLPESYADFQDEPPCEYAWAWRVASSSRSSGTGMRVSLSLAPATGHPAVAPQDAGETQAWPAGLAVLRHMLRQRAMPQADTLVRSDRQGTQWSWSTAHA